ncbi:glycosyltransferase family 2 protein [Flavobacterium sp. 2]|uniref:glycosyltransferase family 2 protein n=1 Tax=Flavobacterium sp. 2 TaxID=308053 RepID=UPI003CE7D383
MISPKITILLATYNRSHLIKETLDSIIRQTYTNWECIIVDDNSTDATKDVVAEYTAKDDRFSYYLKTNAYKKGLSGTRNQGLDLASSRNTEFIQFFDDDDIMHPQKLELQMEPLLNDDSLSFTTCKYRHYYGNEELVFSLNDYDCNIEIKNNLLKDFYSGFLKLNSLGPLWKSNVILKYRFDEELVCSEERDLYLKIFLIDKIKFKGINYILFYYRKHDKSNTSNRYSDLQKNVSLYRSKLNFYNTIVLNNLWTPFLLKEMLKRYVLICFDANIYQELKKVIDKDEINLGYRKYLLKAVLSCFIGCRKFTGKFISKI